LHPDGEEEVCSLVFLIALLKDSIVIVVAMGSVGFDGWRWCMPNFHDFLNA
jgi:hypothetical protein